MLKSYEYATYSVDWNTFNGFNVPLLYDANDQHHHFGIQFGSSPVSQPSINYITPFWIGKCSSMYCCDISVPNFIQSLPSIDLILF
ncbi:hypothetical protein OUZ56_001250 [Daphnia magna]|uniref:Uncharacterized protein n=1 Tax=Daphnia magna TaxID=35525 RepID=A0ABR0A2N7_9CRUS|nr:hypothetical protein OUZ56_001250 [Daphnia magna]